MHSEGKYAKELWTEYPASAHNPRISHESLEQARHYPKMNGRMVFKHAVTRMVEVSHEVLSKSGKSVDEVDLLLPHQANLRINQMVASHLGIPEEKMVNTIEWTGNTTAATIPICMHEALGQGKLKDKLNQVLTRHHKPLKGVFWVFRRSLLLCAQEINTERRDCFAYPFGTHWVCSDSN